MIDSSNLIPNLNSIFQFSNFPNMLTPPIPFPPVRSHLFKFISSQQTIVAQCGYWHLDSQVFDSYCTDVKSSNIIPAAEPVPEVLIRLASAPMPLKYKNSSESSQAMATSRNPQPKNVKGTGAIEKENRKNWANNSNLVGLPFHAAAAAALCLPRNSSSNKTMGKIKTDRNDSKNNAALKDKNVIVTKMVDNGHLSENIRLHQNVEILVDAGFPISPPEKNSSKR